MSRITCSQRTIIAVALLTLLAGGAAAQGTTLNLRIDGTHNDVGFITRIDTTAGYRFNRYFAVDAGLPFYVVRPSAQALPLLNATSQSGIGNAHASLRLEFGREGFTYSPSLTVTAPTGSKDKGLSTGGVTWDWSNLLQRKFGPVAPYGVAGLANTVADTPFFVRPFTSRGLVVHLEGGAVFTASRHLGIGGSVYADEPSGQQTVLSRVGRQRGANGSAAPVGRGRSRNGVPPPFETAETTTGPAAIARDRGASTWLAITPAGPALELQLGYSRSVTYSLDTIFVGVGVDMGHLIRKTRAAARPAAQTRGSRQ